MPSIFDTIRGMAEDAGVYSQNYRRGLRWFRNTIDVQLKGTNRGEANKLFADSARVTKQILPGHFYMFYYPEPKHKDRLKYYDRFPLFLCIGKTDKHLLGLNLHYYPPKMRTLLFLDLLQYRNTTNIEDNTRLFVNYNRMKRDPRLREMDLSIKKYLRSKIRSRIIHIKGPEWPIALYLPFERFRHIGRQQVWAETRRDEAST